MLAEASWQLATAPLPGTVMQLGLQGIGRASPGHSDANWHHLQVAAGALHAVAPWRYSTQASIGWVGGALQAAYQLTRWSLAAERDGLGCAHRGQIEQEVRRIPSNTLNDGRSTFVSWNLLCPVRGSRTWKVGLGLRGGSDEPLVVERPGGRQRNGALTLRALGDLADDWRVDGTLRLNRSLDALGYNPLLQDDARRAVVAAHLHVEFARGVEGLLGLQQAAEYVVQLQWLRHSSNLPLFSYSSAGLYAGIRVRW